VASATRALQLDQRTPTGQRRWAVRYGALLDLATGRALRGDPDGSWAALKPVLALDPVLRTARLNRRLTGLRRVVAAAPWRQTPVALEIGEAARSWPMSALNAPRRKVPAALPAD
jgi:hypothetical protein